MDINNTKPIVKSYNRLYVHNNLEKLQNIVQEFNRQQLPLSLLAPGDTFALVRTAMAKYEN